MKYYETLTKEDLEGIVPNIFSKAALCRALRLSNSKWSMDKAVHLVSEHGISVSHFDPNKGVRKYERVIENCPICNSEFERIIGSKKSDRKACSRSCVNKLLKSKEKSKTWKVKSKCPNCDNIMSRSNSKFCSKKCSARHKTEIVFNKIEAGEYVMKNNNGNSKHRLLKKYLVEKFGHKCFTCGNSEWMGVEIPLQLDHKDGDSDNNVLSNLRLLCPNCHAQTPTYCRKNKNGKRTQRLLDYHSGKENW